ncbi:rho gtpase-activating protein 68f [Anaeramoeba flamelloides]|uniref:Rho gtpase-activating protein 68f n=1 Tax=Anaeramoeba flamelloides TaxID=1746091 RepID=A0AAV7Y6Y8_9EUKA|nr:rho gtpase-activating protein 68f [Anaeramoeba flamelloides]
MTNLNENNPPLLKPRTVFLSGTVDMNAQNPKVSSIKKKPTRLFMSFDSNGSNVSTLPPIPKKKENPKTPQTENNYTKPRPKPVPRRRTVFVNKTPPQVPRRKTFLVPNVNHNHNNYPQQSLNEDPQNTQSLHHNQENHHTQSSNEGKYKMGIQGNSGQIQSVETNVPKRRPIEETRIFGVPLQVAIEREGRDETSPPSIIEKAIMYLEEKGKFEEGIYRLSGSVLRMNNLRDQFDRGEEVTLQGIKDQNTVGSLIKLYFRELPEPILGEKYTPRLSKLSQQSEEIQKKRLIHVYNNIPEVNKAVLRWLLPHLYRVSLQSEKNLMRVENLAIVFAPTLHVPLKLMAFMITHWMDILCDDENEKEQKKKRIEKETQQMENENENQKEKEKENEN